MHESPGLPCVCRGRTRGLILLTDESDSKSDFPLDVD